MAPGRSDWFLAVQILITGHGLVDLRNVQHFPFPGPPSEQLLDALLADLGLSSPAPEKTTKKRPTPSRGPAPEPNGTGRTHRDGH